MPCAPIANLVGLTFPTSSRRGKRLGRECPGLFKNGNVFTAAMCSALTVKWKAMRTVPRNSISPRTQIPFNRPYHPDRPTLSYDRPGKLFSVINATIQVYCVCLTRVRKVNPCNLISVIKAMITAWCVRSLRVRKVNLGKSLSVIKSKIMAVDALG